MKFAKLKKDGTVVAILNESSKTKINLIPVSIPMVEHGKNITKQMSEVKDIETLCMTMAEDGKRFAVSTDDLDDIKEVEDDDD